jgi:hypothetical protein
MTDPILYLIMERHAFVCVYSKFSPITVRIMTMVRLQLLVLVWYRFLQHLETIPFAQAWGAIAVVRPLLHHHGRRILSQSPTHVPRCCYGNQRNHQPHSHSHYYPHYRPPFQKMVVESSCLTTKAVSCTPTTLSSTSTSSTEQPSSSSSSLHNNNSDETVVTAMEDIGEVDVVALSTATDTTTISETNEATPIATSDGETETDTTHVVGMVLPSYSKLIAFASTTVLIWLSEPLLSLVDTTMIGQFASSSTSIIQLASLGPATTYIDSLFYTMYFLSIATTNLVARNVAQRNYEQLHRTVSYVMTIAVLLGAGCTLVTYTIAPHWILPPMAGRSGTIQLLFYATRYIYIRASVAIASILAVTSQSILLATKDTRTPAMAVVATSLTNIVGDVLLRRYGVQGAAIATAVATIVSSTILLRAVYLQWNQWKQLASTTTTTTTAAPSSRQQQVVPIVVPRNDRSFRKPSFFSMFQWPDRQSAYQLMTLAGPCVVLVVFFLHRFYID